MKRFQIITEADARVLDYGSTVALAAGGHVTPLADDTLRDRRITVVGDEASVDEARLVPPARIQRLALGSDHAGVGLKKTLRDRLRGQGLAVQDVGTESTEPVDYPDIALAVSRLVARGEADAGIVIDGAGLGSAIAANKVTGVRAAMCTDATLARYARQHNGANVLALGATLVNAEQAVAIVRTFLETPMTEPRYIRRLAKVQQIERDRG